MSSPRKSRRIDREPAGATWHRRLRPRAVGASPVAVEAPPDAAPTVVGCHLYGGQTYTTGAAPPVAQPGQLRWIDIGGLADQEKITGIARDLGLSDLAIADLFHLDQRPHTEVSETQVQIVLRMPFAGPPFDADQITLVLGPDFVLSVREGERDCLGPVRDRLASGKGRIRSSSAYLFYALADAIIDSYFPVLERYGDVIETLEEHILAAPQDGTIREVHGLKHDLLDLRHALWPLREAIAVMLRDGTPHIDETLLPYLRDCSDHAFQLLDMVEVYRETAQGLVDLQLSSLSNRMNEIMKVLTMIATVFIPMTFIAGVYGMNFDRSSPYNLPELGWNFGYLFALALMAGTAAAMLALFWRLGWVFKRKRTPHDDR